MALGFRIERKYPRLIRLITPICFTGNIRPDNFPAIVYSYSPIATEESYNLAPRFKVERTKRILLPEFRQQFFLSYLLRRKSMQNKRIKLIKYSYYFWTRYPAHKHLFSYTMFLNKNNKSLIFLFAIFVWDLLGNALIIYLIFPISGNNKQIFSLYNRMTEVELILKRLCLTDSTILSPYCSACNFQCNLLCEDNPPPCRVN